MHIAYVVSRFPKVSETFITREIRVLQDRGEQIDLYSLVREHEGVVHPEALPLLEQATFGTGQRAWVLRSQLWWLLRSPTRYFGAWIAALAMNLRSPAFLARSFAVVPAAAAFARQMQSDGVERVHAHWGTHPALVAFVIARLTDLPYSLTIHAHDLYEDTTGLAVKVRAASNVVTISELNRGLIERLAPEVGGRLHVIRCGADLGLFGAARVVDESAKDQATRIVCVGSLDEYKGHAYLVDACAELVTRGLALTCRIIGDGPDRAALTERIANRRLAEVVTLTGRLTSEFVRSELVAADIFVLPSVVTRSGKMEGIPVALMEAMASGLPVIASDISGIPELVEHETTGLLVPPADPAAIADAVERLASEPGLRRAIAQAAIERIRTQYDLRANTAQLQKLLFTPP